MPCDAWFRSGLHTEELTVVAKKVNEKRSQRFSETFKTGKHGMIAMRCALA